MRNERINEFHGLTGAAKAANHHGGAVGYAGNGTGRGGHCLVDHGNSILNLRERSQSEQKFAQ